MELARTPAPVKEASSAACSPRSAPTSSPVSLRHPPVACASGTATAQRSASGSLASTRSAPASRASARDRSRAPGSSGLGESTVGKSGSGSNCSATTTTSSKPARTSASRQTRPPTPCRAVSTIRSGAGAAARTERTAASRYSSTMSAPTVRQPEAGRGTRAAGPTAAMRRAISSSSGGTIWAPRPGSVTARPPRYTLYPLSPGGLCEAVTMTPASAPRRRSAKASTGVGQQPSNRTARPPAPVTTRAVSRAKTSESRRAS